MTSRPSRRRTRRRTCRRGPGARPGEVSAWHSMELDLGGEAPREGTRRGTPPSPPVVVFPLRAMALLSPLLRTGSRRRADSTACPFHEQQRVTRPTRGAARVPRETADAATAVEVDPIVRRRLRACACHLPIRQRRPSAGRPRGRITPRLDGVLRDVVVGTPSWSVPCPRSSSAPAPLAHGCPFTGRSVWLAAASTATTNSPRFHVKRKPAL
jgi:hypothetical protein